MGNILLLAFAAYYLHHTLPNANNTQKHPCFCFGCRPATVEDEEESATLKQELEKQAASEGKVSDAPQPP